MLFDGDYAILVTGNENGGISAAHYKRLIIPLFFPPVKAGVFIFRPVRRLFFGQSAQNAPPGRALLLLGPGPAGGRASLCRISCIRAAGEKFYMRIGTERRKRPPPLPTRGTETAFSLFLGRGRGHSLSSCSCRETRSIMRAYPSAPYTRHLRTRVIVAEETPVCSLMALNVSPS